MRGIIGKCGVIPGAIDLSRQDLCREIYVDPNWPYDISHPFFRSMSVNKVI
jgi:hypothetical protein